MKHLLFATIALSLSASAAAAQDAAFTLNILHVNDIHSRIEPVNRFDSTCSAEADANGKCFGGAARLKTFLDRMRVELSDENVLVLDAGDQFLGTLFYTTYKGSAAAEMMNTIGFDAMAVGNHEFDDGPQVLANFADNLDAPLISGNLDLSQSDILGDRQINDTLILTVGDKRVGLVSAVATDTAELSAPGPNIIFQDAVDALQADVDTLTALGVDMIIALTHVGLNHDREIAESVTGIDAIVGGHTHTLMSNTVEGALPYPTFVNGVPVVQAYAYGKYVGHLVLSFDAGGNVTSASGDTILLDASVTPDPAIAARITELAGPIDRIRQKVVAETTAVLSNEGCRVAECALGSALADAMLDRVKDQGIDIAIQNGGGIRAGFDEGEVTMGEVLIVLPFQDTVATFTTTSDRILAALENGVSQVEDTAGRFLQVAGLSYSYNPSAPAGQRVSDVMVGDTPLELDRRYGVATNSYIRGGGDGFTMFLDADDAYDYGPQLTDVLADYLGKNGQSFAPYTDGRIRVLN